MSVEQNIATLRRLYDEVWNKGNMSAIPELVSDHYRFANFIGPAGFQNLVSTMRGVFPDMNWTIESIVGEGEWLAVRLSYTGTFLGKLGDTEPTGKAFSATRALFNRFERGKLVEAVPYVDHLALYQQIGVVPPNPVEEQNKAVVRRFIEAGNNIKGDVSKIPAMIAECLAPDHVHHTPSMGSETKLAETTVFYNMVFSAFPDIYYAIDSIVAEGDKVVMQLTSTMTHKGTFQGIPATGNRITNRAVDVFRVTNGKITDEWSYPDLLGMMQQLGAILPGRPSK